VHIQRIGPRGAAFLEGMRGLGDTIYMRAAVRRISTPLVLSTSWPQLFSDIPNIQCAKPFPHRLRTQRKNEEAFTPAGGWGPRPARPGRTRMHYSVAGLRAGRTILQQMEGIVGGANRPLIFDLPPTAGVELPAFSSAGKPLAIIRPVTLRTEWLNESRAPKAEYIAAIAERLMASHHVVLLADLAEGAEWMVEPVPPHHEAFLGGELSVLQLVELFRQADVTVGGVGWVVPMAMATGARLFVVSGGNGGSNAPGKILDSRVDCSRIGWAIPERFCLCYEMRHDCDKTIRNPVALFEKWAAEQGLALCPKPPRPLG